MKGKVMTRNLRFLCLALVAMLTMGIAASSAMAAAEFHLETTPSELTGVQEGTNTFATDSGTFHCTSVKFTGSYSSQTTGTTVLTPFTSGCRSTGFTEANITIDTNGCKYNLTAEGTTSSSIHITGCNSGTAGIVITAPFCTITVTPQTVGPVHYINTGAGTTREVIAEFTASNLVYHESGAACKNATTSNTTGGSYTGKVRLTGENPTTKAHHGIWWL